MTPAEIAAIAIAVVNLIAAGLGQGLTEVCNLVTGTTGGGGDAPTGVVDV